MSAPTCMLALDGADRGATATLAGIAFIDGFSAEMTSDEAHGAQRALDAAGVVSIVFLPHRADSLESIAERLQSPVPAPADNAGSTPPQLEAQVGQAEQDTEAAGPDSPAGESRK